MSPKLLTLPVIFQQTAIDTDQLYIQRCLELARLGAGRVGTNPMVGCVIVRQGLIIGEGWHAVYGGPHAEVMAVNSVGDVGLLSEATLYVSLEPCFHHGKTPPCVELILRHRIPRVVIAAVDPNPKVAGKSIALLRKAGVEVSIGLLEAEARNIMRSFIALQEKHRPFVLLKWAQTANGFIAPPEGQRWISNAYSGRLAHKWRRELDAILVGRKTAQTDNPRLTDRHWGGPMPLRVVIAPEDNLDPALHLLTDGHPTLVFNKHRQERKGAVEFLKWKAGEFNPPSLLRQLAERGISGVQVEGGAFTLNQFIESGCWDEAAVIRTPVQYEEGIPAPQLPVSAPVSRVVLHNNTVEIYRPL